MASLTFVDTNVLVCAVDQDSPGKRRIARHLLESAADDLVLSAQVLSEYYWAVTRRLRRPVPPETAAAQVESLSRLPVTSIDAGLAADAISLGREAQVAYWDALILAAARRAGCKRLLTEDLAAGATPGASTSRTRS